MMGIGLNTGLNALLAARAALDTIGHNVSNANTEGYSRQDLLLSSGRPQLLRGLAIGTGVRADVVMRTADALLGRRLVGQQSSLAQLDARLTGMGQVESLLGEPGEHGLSQLLDGFFSGFSSLASNPTSPVLRTGAVAASQSLASRFQELSSNLGATREQLAGTIRAQTSEVNSLTKKIVDLNREIRTFEAGGTGARANDLRDQRELALQKLGSRIDVNYTESSDGSVSVYSGGSILASASHAYELSADVTPAGDVTLRVAGQGTPIMPHGGSLGGLMRVAQEFVPALATKLDQLAHELARATNAAHSTGLPASGAFHSLTATNAVADTDEDGSFSDERLGSAGLPFDVGAGALWVSVTDESTGTITRTKLEVDPDETVGTFVGALGGIAHVDASLDAGGRLRIEAQSGYAFDFSRRLDPQPDHAGTFGGAAASLGSASAGPYALNAGDTLSIAGPFGNATVAFSATDFADISHATADEVAAVLDGDPAVESAGLRAVASGGQLFLQSTVEGASASFTVQGGTALAAFGWSAGTQVTGQANDADVTISGAYTGAADQTYTFVPQGDGTIGTTPGLSIGVFDAGGKQVAMLDVGADYVPGTKLAIADGVEVAFGLGEVSATDHDAVTLDAIADSDTSDVLVAFGLNSFFSGSSAADISVEAGIAADPSRIASSSTGASGDNGVLHELAAVEHQLSGALGGTDPGAFWGGAVTGVGLEISSATNARDVDQLMFDSLTAQREQVSGVDVDEELVHMIRFEQAFGAAARYIQTVNDTNAELMQLL
jgi:flagellar hook-associated protein FlgK